MAKHIFSRFDADLMVRSDDADPATPAAEPSAVEKMVLEAIADLKGFCDSVRSDVSALSGRMDSFDSSRQDAQGENGGAVEAVETPAGVPPIDTAPAATEAMAPGEDAPADIALETPPVAATELAADSAEDLAAMADSAAARHMAPLRADIDRLTRMIPGELSIEQRQQFAAAQEQAEVAFQSFGDHAPAPMQGEGIGTYKRRLAGKMQTHSDKWKATKLTAIADDATLDVIVGDIYNDAVAVARKGADVPQGTLSAVRRRTEAGHTVIEYRGSPGAWMRPLAGATRRATGKFNMGRN